MIRMGPSEQQWIIVFDGRQVYQIKSRKTCIKIVLLALLLLFIPILVIVITYLVDPCFLLGTKGKMNFHVPLFQGNIWNNVIQYFCFSIDIDLFVSKGWQCAVHNLEPQLEGKTTLKLCKSMDEYLAIPLIDAINKERRKVGKHDIPASDDMCATALFKGLAQMVRFLNFKA